MHANNCVMVSTWSFPFHCFRYSFRNVVTATGISWTQRFSKIGRKWNGQRSYQPLSAERRQEHRSELGIGVWMMPGQQNPVSFESWKRDEANGSIVWLPRCPQQDLHGEIAKDCRAQVSVSSVVRLSPDYPQILRDYRCYRCRVTNSTRRQWIIYCPMVTYAMWCGG